MIRLTPHPKDPQKLVAFSQADGGDPHHGSPVAAAQAGWSLMAPQAPSTVQNVIVWSGSAAQIECPDDGLFESDPRTWGAAGWQGLASGCAAAANLGSYLVRPHARHVISDVPSMRRFAGTIAAAHPGAFSLLLDPASMVDLRHVEQRSVEDMFRRIAEERPTLNSPAFPLAGIVIGNIRCEADRVVPTPIEEGLIEPEFIRQLFC